MKKIILCRQRLQLCSTSSFFQSSPKDMFIDFRERGREGGRKERQRGGGREEGEEGRQRDREKEREALM